MKILWVGKEHCQRIRIASQSKFLSWKDVSGRH